MDILEYFTKDFYQKLRHFLNTTKNPSRNFTRDS